MTHALLTSFFIALNGHSTPDELIHPLRRTYSPEADIGSLKKINEALPFCGCTEKEYFCLPSMNDTKTESMKKQLLLAGAWELLMCSCQSMMPLSIDYMLPAEISFPAELKKVAVVNNVPAYNEKDFLIRQEEKAATKTEGSSLTQFFRGDADRTTESLAEGLADGNYFEEVIICDSTLQTKGGGETNGQLTTEQVDRLSYELGADFLLALEDVQIKAVRKVEYSPVFQAYFGSTDLKVVPTVRIYLPGRRAGLHTVQSTDSIFWEEIGGSFEEAEARLISNKELVEQASEFAGSIPVKKMLPHWETASRILHTGGCVEMRDAAVYVRENNWSEALPLWRQVYEKAKGKKKMRAAHNLALGYEMQDNLQQALEWAKKAQELAFDADQVEQKKNTAEIDADEVPNYALESLYVTELEKRTSQMALLNTQMERFRE